MLLDHSALARLDLNLLVALDALISEGHVTRAAERTGIKQSAMSHNLRRLRSLFGDELLIRSGTEMLPTPRARELAATVRSVFLEVQSVVVSSAVFDPTRVKRSFTIGVSPSREITLLPRLLASMHAQAPNIRLNVRSDGPEIMLRDLDTGAIDLAVGTFVHGGMHHRRRVLFRAEGYLCLYDQRRTELSAPISIEEFVRIPHITVLSTDHTPVALDRSLAELRTARHVIYQTPHVQAVPFLLREIEAIAILCKATAAACADTFGLATSPLPIELPEENVDAVWHGSHGRDPAHMWLRQKLFDVAGSQQGATRWLGRSGKREAVSPSSRLTATDGVIATRRRMTK
jgi:LysR family transcriptional activator of mexEF-oprN operon